MSTFTSVGGGGSPDPIFTRGIQAGTPPVLQEGSRFTARQWGLDDGRRTFLVHPQTSRSAWPKKGAADADHPGMFVVDVTDTADESTLIKLEVSYKGFSGAGTNPRKIAVSGDIQMLTIPGTGTAGSANFLVGVPQPTVSSELVVTTQPDLTNIGTVVTSDYLPSVPDFSITLASTATPTENYLVGWVYQTVSWEEIVLGKVWLVRQQFVYNHRLVSA